jgi:hypothetical protein
MKTPSVFNKNLKNGCVNHEMLGACIYSFNKRAKNFRDNIRDLVYSRRYAHWRQQEYIQKSIDSAAEKRDEYYGYKDYFLSLLEPCEIHTVIRWNERFEKVSHEYYLYYKVDNYSFHHPISKNEVNDYNLEVSELPLDFSTEGAYIEDLISVQFAKKVYQGLKDGSLQLVA